MKVVVSPYHLTTREAPAMAMILLAEKVFTLLPASFEDPSSGASKRAAARSPWYSRFVESWSWTVPLWEEGVLASQLDEDDAAADMRHVADRIKNDEQFLALRPLMRDQLYESEHTYLSSLGADLLKGGPDPGITVPLSAALDRFARRHVCGVARAQPVSVVQRAEASFARKLFAVAIPVLLQASADHVLFARELLEPQLQPLRSCIARLIEARGEGAFDAAELSALAADYARAFDEHSTDLRGTADDEVRVVAGSVVVNAVAMPADVVLRSSLVAVEALGRGPRAALDTQSEHRATTALPVLAADAGSVVSLVVKPMGVATPKR